jgi:hypothetical protein
MATVKFIKDHPAGIPEGTERTVPEQAAQRWLEQGYVELVTVEAGEVAHTITQGDLDNNPELVEKGVKVGDVVGIPEGTEAPSSDNPDEKDAVADSTTDEAAAGDQNIEAPDASLAQEPGEQNKTDKPSDKNKGGKK